MKFDFKKLPLTGEPTGIFLNEESGNLEWWIRGKRQAQLDLKTLLQSGDMKKVILEVNDLFLHCLCQKFGVEPFALFQSGCNTILKSLSDQFPSFSGRLRLIQIYRGTLPSGDSGKAVRRSGRFALETYGQRGEHQKAPEPRTQEHSNAASSPTSCNQDPRPHVSFLAFPF